MIISRNKVKKTIALSFLLLANSIILAHAIISHHPLEDIQPAGQCNHENLKDCPLTTLYIKLDNDKPILQTHNFNLILSLWVLTPFSDNSILPIPKDIGLPFRQKPFLLFYSADFISLSLGWRAPPFGNYEL